MLASSFKDALNMISTIYIYIYIYNACAGGVDGDSLEKYQKYKNIIKKHRNNIKKILKMISNY